MRFYAFTLGDTTTISLAAKPPRPLGKHLCTFDLLTRKPVKVERFSFVRASA